MTEARGFADRDGGTRGRYAPGTPCWVSLVAHGLDATQEFYGELFGWEFRPGPRQLGPYVRALIDGQEVAGVGQLPADRHLPVAWTPYFAADDVDGTAGTVRHCGGTIGVGPLDAADAGRLAIGSDPSGAVLGLWQADAHLGIGITGVPGTPVWYELLTYDTESVVKFYATLFGYVPEPAGDVVTLRLDGRPVAALHGLGSALPRDRGPHWLTYFAVADVDAALERVNALGGHTLTLPHEAPQGRTATAADPEGARFALLQQRAV